MKKIMSILAAMLVLTSVVAAEELKVATFEGNQQFMPAVTAILKDAGYEVKPVVFKEQGEMIGALAKSEADIVFFLAQPLITGVKGAQFISARLMSTDFCAVTVDPAVVIKNAADLKKYKIGIVKDNAGHVAATRGVPNVVEAADTVEQFKMLKNGDVQAVISVRDLIVPMTMASGLKNPIVCEPPVMKNPTFLALSPKAAAKKAELDAVFTKALNDGVWGKELGKLKR